MLRKTLRPSGAWMLALALLACGGESAPVVAPVVLATTTSTYDSGLLDVLVPLFEQRSGMKVKTVAVGTGQALEMGRRGEADLLLVHAPAQELEFVAKGHGRNRRAVMHNDFVIVGPRSDPAGIAGGKDAAVALGKIAAAKAPWISRGDRSGTHIKEQAIWSAAGIEPGGEWYTDAGQGMGATLRVASEREAYTLSDRGTFIAVTGAELVVHVEGDERLFNPYHVVEVVGDEVNGAGARALADFFVDPRTQRSIAGFAKGGQRLFTPDASEPAR